MATSLNVNGQTHAVTGDPKMPLLWVLRDILKLTGTKYGCGIEACGACTVLVDGRQVRSCGMPLASAVGRSITTIEGLSSDNSHPVQQAWTEMDVPECGYCQSGMILAVVSLLKRNAKPSDQDIDRTITNLCRCGTYNRVRAAVHRAAELMA
jgi:isoquinoline 1-oxidoreductase alpha subunit